jgi:hypothetical protein
MRPKTTTAGPDKVIPGSDDGGDGGQFNGILARYLADTALRLPRAYRARCPIRPGPAPKLTARPYRPRRRRPGPPARWGPVFAPNWCRPARAPRPGVPEADLSVQLSAWMRWKPPPEQPPARRGPPTRPDTHPHSTTGMFSKVRDLGTGYW